MFFFSRKTYRTHTIHDPPHSCVYQCAGDEEKNGMLTKTNALIRSKTHANRTIDINGDNEKEERGKNRKKNNKNVHKVTDKRVKNKEK